MGAFEGQVVFITGASSGIGAALARAFARDGADIALAARRLDRLRAVQAEVQTLGRRAHVVACDVTRDGDLERAVAETRRALGPVAVAVANAGFGVMGEVARLTLDDYRRQFETNVFGVLRTLYATLEDLRSTRGRFVIVGSVSGHISTPGASAYGMSKFALRALAQSLGPELARDGIAVVLVSPGFVESELHEVDNAGVRHAGVRHPQARLRMPAATAARHIVRATARRRRETVVTMHGKLAVFFQRHVPGLVATVIRRVGVRGRPQPGASRP
jgi:short-subunit dehydrogenase